MSGKKYFTYNGETPSMPIASKNGVTGNTSGDHRLHMEMISAIAKHDLPPDMLKKAHEIAASFGPKPQNG